MKEATGNTIMVVDDTEANIDILLDFLGDDYDVRVAVDGQSALDQIAGETPDLILLDIMMPGMSGIEVLEHLKKNESFRHIPVIMISALDEMKTVVQCIELGAEDYLPKPFDHVLLRARIGASLEKKRLRDAEQDYLRTILQTQEKLNKELSEAAQYVKSLLPAPLSGTVSTAWRFIPSTQLGGDSFGYYWIDDGHFALFLLDVCGHGVGAALLSITIMNVIRSGSLPETDFRDPAAVLKALNERFQMDTQNDMYFTIWYGVFDCKTRRLDFGTAGHPLPILLTGSSERELSEEKLRGHGSPIGWDLDTIYEAGSVQCGPYARLYVFSDGVYEIRKPDGEMMTYREFTQIVSAAGIEGDGVIEHIEGQARALLGSGSFDDDFSLLEVTFH